MSKTFSPSDFKVGELVQVYVCHLNQERDKWLSPCQAIDFHTDTGLITVTGLAAKKVIAAVEDTRAAFPISYFSEFVISIIDYLDDPLQLEIELFNSCNESNNKAHVSNHQHALHDDKFGKVSKGNSNMMSNLPDPSLRDGIEVFWPPGGVFYAGRVTEVTDECRHVITYSDTEVETLNMSEQSRRPISNITIQGNTILLQLKYNTSSTLKKTAVGTRFKTFTWHQAQVCRQHILQLALKKKEEEVFLSIEKGVSRHLFPSSANIISSYVFYKVKVNNDGSL